MKTLKQARKAAGVKQSELAEKLGVARSYICHWENGTRNVPQARRQKIVDFLGQDIDFGSYIVEVALSHNDVKKIKIRHGVGKDRLATFIKKKALQ